jgi:signal recognition particle subunit SRP19
VPPLDDRLPLHTPVAQTGVALAAVKRDIEVEKEAKKKGVGGGEGEKMPKMKRVVVRGKR